MPQQRIHKITADRVERLKASINESREKCGEKKYTAPDIIEAALAEFENQHNQGSK